jgi:adenine-specific DNA-methyltransferase
MAKGKKSKNKKDVSTHSVGTYRHSKAESLLRPDVGTQAQFTKKKPPKRYRYDSSLSPSLEWDGQNYGRELGEWFLATIQEAAKLPPPHTFPQIREFRDAKRKVLASVTGLQDAMDQLRSLSKPFLNWAGKAERSSFEAPTLPLFVHERLSTKAIIETLKGHKRDKQMDMFDLFGDPQLAIHEQILRAYEHKGGWTNRLILGDSLVVMNSLLEYEGLGGQVQMIYIDPPYGVQFGSNFQPFVRKRDVTHNDDDDFTREPEMVKAYRDTWELGLHSYLSYIRDRLLVSKGLLHETGSVFVQIGDENLHHMREILDEVFGADNFISQISFRKKTMPLGAKNLEQMHDFIVWYAKNKERMKYKDLFRTYNVRGLQDWKWLELPDKSRREMTPEEIRGLVPLPDGARVYRLKHPSPIGDNPKNKYSYVFEGRTYSPPLHGWGVEQEKFDILVKNRRVQPKGNILNYILYFDDFPVTKITNPWNDTIGPQDKSYVVQTDTVPIQRCLLMTSDPGDLVLDLTCGSGTTAYVAEEWGRRWITIDVSRVPLALTRQRLLTATFPYYELKEEVQGPAGGFVYKRKQSKKGEEVGGIVPHITLESIANDEPPKEEVLVDRPEVNNKIVRVSGPFTVEATIPTPVDWDEKEEPLQVGEAKESYGSFTARMLETLRKAPVLQVRGGKTLKFRNIRAPAKTLSLSGEALVTNGDERPVAFVFGPENGALSEKLVYEAAKEAHAKSYSHLYVIGFAIQPNARLLIENCEAAVGITATYVQVTPDVTMGDLLKNMRSSQIFSVCGLPEIKTSKLKPKVKDETERYQVEVIGLDVFDPVTMETDHMKGNDIPAWFLDTDYNSLCFHVCQAFFPRTSAWENLKKSLKGQYEDQMWEHLAGTTSASFEAGEHKQIAVKVIDDRGNELVVVKSLQEV